jgi:hypothetical protein
MVAHYPVKVGCSISTLEIKHTQLRVLDHKVPQALSAGKGKPGFPEHSAWNYTYHSRKVDRAYDPNRGCVIESYLFWHMSQFCRTVTTHVR